MSWMQEMPRLWIPETGGGSVPALLLEGLFAVPCRSNVEATMEDQGAPEGCQGQNLDSCCHVSDRVSGHTLFDLDLAEKSIRKEAGLGEVAADHVQLERKRSREDGYFEGLAKTYQTGVREVWCRLGSEAKTRVGGQRMRSVGSQEHHIVVARRSL